MMGQPGTRSVPLSCPDPRYGLLFLIKLRVSLSLFESLRRPRARVPPPHFFGSLEKVFRSNVVIPKTIQGDDCRPRRMSLLRFPWLSPIRNSFELRGLCRRSYFGPRTCGRGITNVIEVSEMDFPGPRNSGSGDSGYGFVDLGGQF